MKHVIRNLPQLFSCALQLLRLLFTCGKKRIILIGSPAHGNLGDIAIAIAELDFFKPKDSAGGAAKIRLVEFTDLFYQRACSLLDRFILKKDVIWIHGGGFIGTLWKSEDDMANHVISTFRGNKIVVFPQTVYFEDGADSAVQEFKRIYGSHKDLTLFLRERNSYGLAKKLLAGTSVRIFCVPDMVLSLSTGFAENAELSDKVLLCFRTDHERTVSQDVRNILEAKIAEKGFEAESISTVLPHLVLRCRRKKELFSLLLKIRSSRLVVTDRLHGMIFAYITGTPAYVFDNLSHKISGVYEWIKGCGYVHLLDGTDKDATAAIDFEEKHGRRQDFHAEYEPLFRVLEECR